MTYFGFLAIFLVTPILLLVGVTWWDKGRGRALPARLSSYRAGVVLAAHVLVALVYTTPWDNYLVATNVWWYDPQLVTGIVIGWVPIEEYTFFILQPIFTGLWLLLWARRNGVVQTNGRWQNNKIRTGALAVVGLIWIVMVGILVIGWQPGTYLALQLAWATVPMMVQVAFGADILWHYRRLILVVLVPTTLYLAFADALAIQAGTWTIDPAQSLHWLIGGVLPIEEFLFFLNTNILVVFGVTLVLARESQERLRDLQAMWRRLRQPKTGQPSSY